MVIVPIIPDYLKRLNGPTKVVEFNHTNYTVRDENATISNDTKIHPLLPFNKAATGAESSAVGILFASKAIVQLIVNPISGTVIDRIGYDIPMMIGLTVMFFSTSIFAFGESYGVLFVARSLQGLGSAFADTSGLAMIADRFTEEGERSKALGIAIAFISFGSLFAPPFGAILYQFAGKFVPFLILAFVCMADGVLMLLVMKPVRLERKLNPESVPKGTPIYQLIIDPYIACCAGCLVMANVSLAFLEPTIAMWMDSYLKASEWEIGLVWLPAFFPHLLGVFVTVKLARSYPRYQWLIAAVGLAAEGVSCLIIPFCKSYGALMIPLMILCFGIAQVDTALLPTLGYLVDIRHVSVYGSVYAIADISYCVAYAVGPMIAGSIVESVGFTWLNVGIFLSNIIYCPLLMFLRKIYTYKPFENEENVLCDEPPPASYKTYNMMNGDAMPVDLNDSMKNHLEQKPFAKTDGLTQNKPPLYSKEVDSAETFDPFAAKKPNWGNYYH